MKIQLRSPPSRVTDERDDGTAFQYRVSFDTKVKASIYAAERVKAVNDLHGEDFSHWFIPLLASFEVRIEGGSTYYLLYDWATGDLDQFRKTNLALVGDKSWLPWVSKQLSGLVGALRCIHNTHSQYRYQSTPHAWHGDIKPSKIFYFESHSGQKTLALGGLEGATLHVEPPLEEDPEGLLMVSDEILHMGAFN